jgi:uncharacterized alpha-E superfamily protein
VISRVAANCFWLHRYLERVESMARALSVNTLLLLDTDVPAARTWRPLLIVTGGEPSFDERFGMRNEADDGESVQSFLVWDDQSPVSIVSSLQMARENARTIRDTISAEMWASLNAFWHWLTRGQGRRLYNRERLAFYDTVRDHFFTFHGATQSTLLHEEPFDFMRLGMQLERAGQTARLLDVKHHALGPTTGGPESSIETVEWLAILRSCSAYEPFFKRAPRAVSGRTVAEFLLLEPSFPRSVIHALTRARNFHGRIRQRGPGVGVASGRALDNLIDRLETATVDAILERGMHDELTYFVDNTATICALISRDFFESSMHAARTAR